MDPFSINPNAFAPSITPVYVPDEVLKGWKNEIRSLIEEVLEEEPTGEYKSYTKSYDRTVEYMYYFEKDETVTRARNNVELYVMECSKPVSRIFNEVKDDILDVAEEEYRSHGTTELNLDRESLRKDIISVIDNYIFCYYDM